MSILSVITVQDLAYLYKDGAHIDFS